MWAIGGGVAVSKLSGAVSTAYRIYEPGPSIWPRFLHYWVRSATAIEQYRLLARGITTFDRSVTREDFDGMPVPVPPLAKQRAIADHLDREMARMNALIAAKRRMVELLNERWRQHLILSLGLGGEIAPGRRRLASLAHVTLGRQRTPGQDHGPNMVRYLRAANVKDGALDLADVKEMNFTPGEQSTFALQPGDILITEGAGSLLAVAATAMYRGELEGVVCFQNTLVRLRPRAGVSADYLLCWCRAAYHAGLFAGIAAGANIFHVSAERIKSLRGSFPEVEDQVQVAATLRQEERDHLRPRDALNAQLALLQERRQALITAAVTGQLDVEEAA